MQQVKQYRSKSVMKYDFGKIPTANINRSAFDRSHGWKGTFDAGYLIPVLVDEVLPGDTFTCNATGVCRMITRLSVPSMDSIYVDFFFFFVPNRILWTNWQRFCGERDPDPDSSIDFTVPIQTTPGGGYSDDSLADYMGIPPGVPNLDVNALHFRAYNKIYNDWFRCEYLQDSVTVDTDNGPDTASDYVLLKRNKRHNYITSALPWPQKTPGVDDEILLPLGEYAPITGMGVDASYAFASGSQSVDEPDGINTTYTKYLDVRNAGTDKLFIEEDADHAGHPGIYTDLSNATSASINEIREAFQLQKMLEKEARGGTRYTSILENQFKVRSPDSRLMRPEYLGGGRMNIDITPISNTATAPGLLGAAAHGSASGIGFSKSFVEHGVILGLACCTCDQSFQHSVDRMWNRQTKYDFYWPSLAHLGEQEVMNRELFAVDGSTDTDADGIPDNEEIFGYVERWSEMRHKNSQICAQLRSNNANSLDEWHLAIDYGDPAADSCPLLNDSFIQEDPPIERVQASTSNHQFIMDMYFKYRCARPLPTFSIPGMIDHF